MANLKEIIKISQADYDILVSGGVIEKSGITYSYDENTLYIVDYDLNNAKWGKITGEISAQTDVYNSFSRLQTQIDTLSGSVIENYYTKSDIDESEEVIVESIDELRILALSEEEKALVVKANKITVQEVIDELNK